MPNKDNYQGMRHHFMLALRGSLAHNAGLAVVFIHVAAGLSVTSTIALLAVNPYALYHWFTRLFAWPIAVSALFLFLGYLFNTHQEN